MLGVEGLFQVKGRSREHIWGLSSHGYTTGSYIMVQIIRWPHVSFLSFGNSNLGKLPWHLDISRSHLETLAAVPQDFLAQQYC